MVKMAGLTAIDRLQDWEKTVTLPQYFSYQMMIQDDDFTQFQFCGLSQSGICSRQFLQNRRSKIKLTSTQSTATAKRILHVIDGSIDAQ